MRVTQQSSKSKMRDKDKGPFKKLLPNDLRMVTARIVAGKVFGKALCSGTVVSILKIRKGASASCVSSSGNFWDTLAFGFI
jgi:hypothetical protein